MVNGAARYLEHQGAFRLICVVFVASSVGPDLLTGADRLDHRFRHLAFAGRSVTYSLWNRPAMSASSLVWTRGPPLGVSSKKIISARSLVVSERAKARIGRSIPSRGPCGTARR